MPEHLESAVLLKVEYARMVVLGGLVALESKESGYLAEFAG